MRDIVILSIVAVMAFAALRRPWVGVMLWTWLSIMNPHRFSWGFAYSAPLAALAAAVTLFGLMITKDRQQPFQGPAVVWLAIFTLWMTLSWLMGVDVTGDYDMWTRVMKIFFMTFVALSLLMTRQHIVAFVWVTVMSLAILGAKGGAFTLLTGGAYRVWGPPGSMVEDNNALALALITCVPLLHFLQLQLKKQWMRHGMSVIMLLCVASALGSQSRGALLALIAMGALMWWRSPKKGVMTVAVFIVVVVLIPFMPESWWSRMETISEYEQDLSAIGRLNGWIVAFEIAKDHLFGAGMSYQHQEFFDLYGFYNDHVIAAHSVYFQILGNHGFIGLFLYLCLWISVLRTCGWLRRNAVSQKETRWASELGAMSQVSLIGFATGGAFLSLPYFDLTYNIMIMVVLARAWVEREGWKNEADLTIMQAAGLKRIKAKTDTMV